MSNKRKNIRNRKNSRNSNIKINILPITILIVLITIGIFILTIKTFKNKAKLAKENTSDEQLYMLFEELNLESKKLASTIEENVIDENNTEDTVINIVTVGEILCENAIYEDAYNANTGEYNFSPMFKNVSNYIKNADIAIGLLETNFVDSKPISGQTLYNSPIELAQEMKNIGIDILNTANNHSLDYGYEGITSTIDKLNELEISHVGTYKSKEDSENFLIKEVKGINLAFLSYTYGTNTKIANIPEASFCLNTIDKDKMKNDIIKAKEQGADYVFVNMHWGDLTSNKQNETQKQLADYLFECGADYIFGSHPASLQPMETRENASKQNVFIAYSTGNFISASKYTNSDIEMILNLQITKVAQTR